MRDPIEEKSKFERLDGHQHYVKWGVTALCVVALSLCVCFLLFRMTTVFAVLKKIIGILSPFIYGFVMAYLLLPIFNTLVRWIEPKLHQAFPKRGRRFAKGLCSLLTLAIGVSIVVVLLWMVLPQFILSIFSLMESMDSYLTKISDWIALLLKDNPVIERNFLQLYQQFSQQIVDWVQNIALPQLVELMTGVVTTLSVVCSLLIGTIIALYMLNSKDTFSAQGKKIIYSLFRVETGNRILERMHYTHRVFGRFISGKLIDSLIIGIICFAGLQILNIPYSVLISVIVGVTNIIPFFGPFIGAVPSAVLILVISPVKALYFILFIILLQQFDGNILGPKVLGNSTGLSSFWVMFAILVSGGLFGIVGMALGVPLFAVIYSIVTEWFNNRLKERALPTDTALYRGNRQLDPQTLEFVERKESVPISKREKRRAKERAAEQKPAEQQPPES